MEHYTQSVLVEANRSMERFNELKQLAAMLRSTCQEGEAVYPGFTNMMGDIWTAFYAVHPQLEEVQQSRQAIQYEMVSNMLQSDVYKRWKNLTVHDELLSVLTAVAIGDQLKEQLQQKKGSQQNRQQGGTEQPSDLSVAQWSNMLQHATENIQQTKQMVMTIGTLDGRKQQQVPLAEQFQLAEHLKTHKTLQKIADLTGRFRRIAQKKQKTKQKDTMERKNVALGQEISRLLPLELAHMMMPNAKLDFLRRYAEQQTLVFDTKGKERRGRGPIVICMDESSSMTSIKEQSKAFCLALLMIARKQKRDFAIIPFATDLGEIIIFPKGQSTAQDILNFSASFLGGGTNYEKPLRASLDILRKSEFKQADVLFVTDGSSFLSSRFLDEFKQVKKKCQFECTSIVLTNFINTVDLKMVQRFSDRVIEVNDLFEADAVFTLT